MGFGKRTGHSGLSDQTEKKGGHAPVCTLLERTSRKISLQDGDRVQAGTTVFEIRIVREGAGQPASPSLCPVCGRSLADDGNGRNIQPIALFCAACLAMEPKDDDVMADTPPGPTPETPGSPRPLKIDFQDPQQRALPVQPPFQPAPRRGARAPVDLGRLTVAPGDGPPVIDGFHVERKLGNGCFGSSFLCRRHGDKTHVVLKVIRTDLPFDPPTRGRLSDELNIVNALNHKHLLVPSDFGITSWDDGGGALCLETEFCAGGNLFQFLNEKGGKLLPHAAYDIMQGALEGLTYLHSQGLLHGNISPQNILLSGPRREQTVKLADIGIAALLRKMGWDQTNSIGYAQNALPFVPWEQERNPTRINPCADIWSMAAVFYHLLTGAYPRESARPQQPGHPAPKVRIVPIRDRFKTVPKGLDCLFDLIDRGLHSDPGKRFQSATDMNEALNQISRPAFVVVSC